MLLTTFAFPRSDDLYTCWQLCTRKNEIMQLKFDMQIEYELFLPINENLSEIDCTRGRAICLRSRSPLLLPCCL